jgi:hypothetical protein
MDWSVDDLTTATTSHNKCVSGTGSYQQASPSYLITAADDDEEQRCTLLLFLYFYFIF